MEPRSDAVDTSTARPSLLRAAPTDLWSRTREAWRVLESLWRWRRWVREGEGAGSTSMRVVGEDGAGGEDGEGAKGLEMGFDVG